VLRDLWSLDRLNQQLQGHVDDYTNNHGTDRRIWSEALGQWRDLYVYVPPGYDPSKCYPFILWLHGFGQDEHGFTKYVARPLEHAILEGKLPPVIVAAPDGSIDGRECFAQTGSFFLNTKAGRFEDYVMGDVWNFVHEHYPIRPEREAHVLAGVSMGGGAAFNLAIKYRDRVATVAAFFPPVNTRYVDCHGNYRAPFDPCCEGLKCDFSRGRTVVARFYGILTVRVKDVLDPVYDRKDPRTAAQIAKENPTEMLETYDLKEGELAMFIGYGGKDEFNMTAQVDSFLHHAQQRGLTVSVAFDPDGRHNAATADRLFPDLLDFLGPRLAPFGR
jgi:S-formylglutathione hydrolase FrmB